MAEPRKNHLNIDGAEVKEDDNIVSYKPIPETDREFKSSKSSLTKSKVADDAEEKLLQKEDEAKITTRVDMADAKYVVGDHRNGDAKIELDANRKQFSGLTKEELLKYAEDPFWVRLRWFTFILFWTLWLFMLAGAIGIIIRAPKCSPPPPKSWYEKGPLVDMGDANSFQDIEDQLELLEAAKVQGVFVPGALAGGAYDVLAEAEPRALAGFTALAEKARARGLRLIVDLTANFVSNTHRWFALSENRTGEYADYFVWAAGGDYDDSAPPKRTPPNKWVSTLDEPAWAMSELRGEYYLHQYAADQPDLNFTNPAVVRRFDDVLDVWMGAGAAGVRLLKARQLLVNASLAEEPRALRPEAAGHARYAAHRHLHTADQPALDALLAHWAARVRRDAEATVFTTLEDGARPELWLLRRDTSALRPPSAASASAAPAAAAAARLRDRLAGRWPALQLTAPSEAEARELAALALLLPAAPVFALSQLTAEGNDSVVSESFSKLVALREDASVEHGNYTVTAIPSNGTELLLACIRWKAGHTGYAALHNAAAAAARADASALPAVPAALTLHLLSPRLRALTNYTNNQLVSSDDILVPAMSTVVLSYVPKTDK